MLIGTVDAIEGGEVLGWAMDTDAPDAPLLLTVLADGRPVASLVAARYRLDVAKVHGTRGYHGFAVNLGASLPPTTAVTVDVRLPDGCPLARSPRVTSVPQAACRTDHTTVVFLHIPKTAGTAFRQAAELAYRPSERLYLYSDDNDFPRNLRIGDVPLEQRARLRFVSGHVNFGVHELLPRPVDYVTLLRRPYERVRSHYVYFLQHQPSSVTRDGHRQSLTEALEDPVDPAFDNLSVRMLAAAVDPNVDPPGTVGREHYERARANLRRFAFVGVQERAQDAFRHLRAKYGWTTGEDLPLANVAASRSLPDEESARRVAEVREQWDMRLYDDACALFGGA